MADKQKQTLPVDLKRDATRDALRLAKKHGKMDRLTAARVGRLIAALLKPRGRRGRRRTEAVSLALAQRAEGKTWRDIYPLAIPGYAELNVHEQRYRADNLRRAVRQARKTIAREATRGN